MTHWGWYWNVKLNHTPKALCSSSSFHDIDSFSMYKQQVIIKMIKESQNREVLWIPSYNLKASLMDNDSLRVVYNTGSYFLGRK